ncbi:uncharacterized protein LOC114544356 [Dendronephthya gigantea]|uniref:uncharacterized protein LOC114544356 n=1 Tax=Dendronephthya gigantea TaxID=151771 RepID=UPI00106BD34F|nr:uncharacterized protein LOC114544356 [Dendronephthya gigantea]
MVKLTKSALKAIVGQQTLSWNDMATVFAEVECLINSRPLGYPSNDANDLQPLTPNHLILGRATSETPQGPFQEYVQSLIQQFWQRFQREYLQSLMRRTKWRQKKRQPKVNDIVMLVDDNLPRGRWNMARIVEVMPGQDGVVRNVIVKTKTGTYKRVIWYNCLMPRLVSQFFTQRSLQTEDELLNCSEMDWQCVTRTDRFSLAIFDVTITVPTPAP